MLIKVTEVKTSVVEKELIFDAPIVMRDDYTCLKLVKSCMGTLCKTCPIHEDNIQAVLDTMVKEV